MDGGGKTHNRLQTLYEDHGRSFQQLCGNDGLIVLVHEPKKAKNLTTTQHSSSSVQAPLSLDTTQSAQGSLYYFLLLFVIRIK